MSSQTQIEKEQVPVQEAEAQAMEAQKEPKAQQDSRDQPEKHQRERVPLWELCDPDLIEIGGGNPWNFYAL